MRFSILKKFLLLLPLLAASVARAQGGPTGAMAQIIVGLQTGNMNWGRFYPNVKQVIAQQTQGTGRYIQLAQLGPVQNIVLVGGIQLPLGWIYNFRSFFPGGAVDWQVASDNAGNVLQLAFQPAIVSVPRTLPVIQQPAPDDGSDGSDTPAPTPRPKPAPVGTGGTTVVTASTKGEACSLFPDLCGS